MQVPGGVRGNTGLAGEPIFSPDGESIAYFQADQLKRVALAGGAPVVICSCPGAGFTWSADNSILFGRGPYEGRTPGVWRVSAAGGEPERVIEAAPGQILVRPQLLPDGAHVLVTAARGAHWDNAEIIVHSLTTSEQRTLVKGMDGRFVSTGHLVFGAAGVLHAVKFDSSQLQLSGKPVPVLSDVSQQVSAGASGRFDYSVSEEGTLVYVPAAAAAIRRTLIWVDRQGREEPLPTEPRAYQYPRLSPDGQHVALDLRDQLNDVWTWDLTRSTLTRLTVGRWAGGPAIWSRDGRSAYFGPDLDGQINLHVQNVSASASPRRLTSSANTQFVDVVTPDGHSLVFAELDPTTRFDLRLLRLDPNAEIQDLVRTTFNEQNAHVSPDGRWLAYQSDESGRFEVYVRPFPKVGDGRWLVSTNGGTRPLWSRDGRELFYLDQNRRMTAVAVLHNPTLSFGRPQTLFETAQFGLEGQQRNFDLSPDGKRFLMVKNLPPPGDVPSLVVIQHWFEELRAKAP